MAKNLSNVRIYGDLATEAYFATLGSTLPTTLTEPTTPFASVGWLSEDTGIDLELSTEVTKFKGMQGSTTLRTKVTSSEKTFKLQCLEESPLVTSMFWGHGAPTVTGTAPNRVARIDLPENVPTVERASVIRFVDNTVEKFLCCSRVEATDRATVPHKNSDMTVYEITFQIIGACYLLTNASAYTGP